MVERHFFRYEHRSQRPLERRRFVSRLAAHVALAMVALSVSLAAGMIGYVHYEHLSWVEAFLNTSMLLGGMGPVDTPQTESGKIFAGVYALYSGIVFLVIAGIILAPVVHRTLHRFHWEDRDLK